MVAYACTREFAVFNTTVFDYLNCFILFVFVTYQNSFLCSSIKKKNFVTMTIVYLIVITYAQWAFPLYVELVNSIILW